MYYCFYVYIYSQVLLSRLCLVRQHCFALENRDELIKSVIETAANHIGIAIRQRKDPITFEQFQGRRLGKYR